MMRSTRNIIKTPALGASGLRNTLGAEKTTRSKNGKVGKKNGRRHRPTAREMLDPANDPVGFFAKLAAGGKRETRTKTGRRFTGDLE